MIMLGQSRRLFIAQWRRLRLRRLLPQASYLTYGKQLSSSRQNFSTVRSELLLRPRSKCWRVLLLWLYGQAGCSCQDSSGKCFSYVVLPLLVGIEHCTGNELSAAQCLGHGMDTVGHA